MAIPARIITDSLMSASIVGALFQVSAQRCCPTTLNGIEYFVVMVRDFVLFSVIFTVFLQDFSQFVFGLHGSILFAIKTIQRASSHFWNHLGDMQINDGCPELRVTQQMLDAVNINAFFQQMGRITVAKCMH